MRVETEGVVLRQYNAPGGRRVIVLFSKKYGKITAGTGITEKNRNKSALAMRPFTYGRYQLFKNRDMYNIDSAETVRSFYKIGEDIDKYMFSSYVLELTEKLIEEGNPAPGLFNLLIDFFDVIELRKSHFETPVIAYELKAMKHLGVMPNLEGCTCCGRQCEPELFCIPEGGLICRECFKKNRDNYSDKLIYKVDFGIVNVLKYFINNPMSKFKKLALDEDVLKVLKGLLRDYCEYYLGIGKLKSESFLNNNY